MGMKGRANRQRIVDAADQLFYARGYNQTSFSDISDQTGIPRGNFYYYFKTKEEILSAVVDARVAMAKLALDKLNKESSDPRQRLLSFANMPIENVDNIIRYGCPIGTLSSELIKEQEQEIPKSRTTAVFDVFLDWCMQQFSVLGFEQHRRFYAMDLLARLQGISVMANVYGDTEFIQRASKDLQDWITKITSH